jgi:1,4-dihydroxy-2-naphthoate octaprenyltransferase
MCGVAVGFLACALLVVNNLRDVPTDTSAGKRTLAVRIGAPATRCLYVALVALPFLVVIGLGVRHPWVLLALAAGPLAVRAARPVVTGATGRDLIPVLQGTGRTELAYAVALLVGLALS